MRWQFSLDTIGVVAVAALIIVSPTAVAVHGSVSLAGSDFEIDANANLRVDHLTAPSGRPSVDWANVVEARKNDATSGQNDDSFGQGSKEDTAIPTVVDGSIPPNKSDLKTFGVYLEDGQDGKFMHLFWTRVQDPSGTTNMDFEFNQSSILSGNGVTPLRTAGDLLIVYELARGGTVPRLFRLMWLDGSEGLSCDASGSFPCWGDRINLTSSANATGSINSSLIPGSQSDGLGPLGPRTFGEASIDLSIIFDPTQCVSFGSAYLKSRSSDSFTAALKDFISPLPVNISNCGTVIIRKQTDPAGVPGSFGFSVADGELDPLSFTLSDKDVQVFEDVLIGSYGLAEDDPGPLGFDLTSIDCSASSSSVMVETDVPTRSVAFELSVGSTVDCTFFNTGRGNIVVDKVTDPADSAESFDFTTNYGPGFSLTDAGPPMDSGDLLPSSASGPYSVAEIPVDGWSTEVACVSSLGEGLTENPGAIDLDPGETVTCTFTNTIERGSILVDKVTDPAGSAQSFDFTTTGEGYDGAFALTDTDAPNDSGPLLPSSEVGTYSVAETPVDGWSTEVACVSSLGEGLTENPGAIDLDPGETVTCTFTNTIERGSILVDKVTDPAGSAQSFDFTTTGEGYDGAFALTDTDAPNDSGPLLPSSEVGTYSVAETPVDGWSTEVACVSSLGEGLTENPGAIDLDPGETVTCTFTNTIERGSILVDKVTDPAGSAQSFDFTTTGEGYDGAFALTDTDAPNDSGPLLPSSEVGTYSVAETPVDGWSTEVACVSSLGEGLTENPGAIDLDPGETVTCTFTNTIERGSILVDKVTDPAGSAQSFDFTTTGEGYDGAFALTDTDAPNDSGPLLPSSEVGTYSVAETPVDGWSTEVACVSSLGEGLTENPGAIDLDPGETVTCTFTNTIERGSILVDKVTDPAGSAQSFDFTTTGEGYDGAFALTDTDAPNDSGPLLPSSEVGTYSVAETPVDGWSTEVACVSSLGEGLTENPGAIDLDPGETVTCTFTNTIERGSILVDKVTDPAGSAQSFDFTTTGEGYDGAFALTDTDAPNDSGPMLPSSEVGAYSVAETPVDGWSTEVACVSSLGEGLTENPGAIDLDPGETVTCTFTNSTGGFLIVKQAKNAALGSGLHPLAGVEFQVAYNDGAVGTFTTGADGTVCVGNLEVGTQYEVRELIPNGYAPAQANPQLVTAIAMECGPPVNTNAPGDEPETITFVNDPLSEIVILFKSLAGDGVTKATSVQCTGPSADGSELGPLDDGDAATLHDLLEGTYTCTIVVDP